MFIAAYLQARPSDVPTILRGYTFLSDGYVASATLVGIGALWYGGVVGFLVAYAALSLAWIWHCVQRKLATERAHEQGTAAS